MNAGKPATEVKRNAINAKVTSAILYYFRGVNPASLNDYTFGEQKSHYPHTHNDLEVFDGSGRLMFEGREFHGGHIAVWRPLRMTTTPEWETQPAVARP